MDCSTPGFRVLHFLPEIAQIHLHWVSDAIYHLSLCRPLLLLPSVFPSIRVFSSESALHIRWPKYWSLSFSISPSSEYSGLISFRIDWFDLPAVQGTFFFFSQGTFKTLLQHHDSKASILWHSTSDSNTLLFLKLKSQPTRSLERKKQLSPEEWGLVFYCCYQYFWTSERGLPSKNLELKWLF